MYISLTEQDHTDITMSVEVRVMAMSGTEDRAIRAFCAAHLLQKLGYITKGVALYFTESEQQMLTRILHDALKAVRAEQGAEVDRRDAEESAAARPVNTPAGGGA